MQGGSGHVTDRVEGPDGTATATFDRGRRYRYGLTREWDRDGPRVNVVMLNPSTADAASLDPTVRRCVGFARAWGCGSLEVTNLFAYRATDPRAMVAHDDPVGSGNDTAICRAARRADRVVVAWGTRGSHRGRAGDVARLLDGLGVAVEALGVTRSGQPAHPLYLGRDTVPVRWVDPGVPSGSAGWEP